MCGVRSQVREVFQKPQLLNHCPFLLGQQVATQIFPTRTPAVSRSSARTLWPLHLPPLSTSAALLPRKWISVAGSSLPCPVRLDQRGLPLLPSTERQPLWYKPLHCPDMRRRMALVPMGPAPVRRAAGKPPRRPPLAASTGTARAQVRAPVPALLCLSQHRYGSLPCPRRSIYFGEKTRERMTWGTHLSLSTMIGLGSLF